jgi:uncharacterized protein YjbI with pentapeptide repeats
MVGLRGCKITVRELTKSPASGVGSERADLTDSNLKQADFSRAKLTVANLSGALVLGADLSNAHLEEADLTAAELSGADLAGAKNLTQSQLDQACGKDPKLPIGLTIAACE